MRIEIWLHNLLKLDGMTQFIYFEICIELQFRTASARIMTALKAFATMVDLAGSCPMVHQLAHVQMELTARDANLPKVNTNQWAVIKIYLTVKIK